MGAHLLVDLLGYTGERGGTETYARELIPRLPAHMPGVRFTALTNRVGASKVAAFFPGEVRVATRVGATRTSWAKGEVFAASRIADRVGADLLWCPANFGPLGGKVPRVVTVHDVIYHEIRGGSVASRIVRYATSWLMSRAARAARGVITVSESASSSIADHLGLAPGRTTVVHNGSTEPRPVDDPWKVLATIGVGPGRPIVLSTGNRMPHKNFEGLLEAVATLPSSERPLTVIPGGHAADPLRPLVSSLGLSADVMLLGWVTREQLEALYAAASVYACPSLVEGFGLPVVDALRRGSRVLANDVPVLREVGGTVADYADATSPKIFGARLAEVIAGPDDADGPAARREWGSTFTWDKSAAATAAVLLSAMNTDGPGDG